MAKMLREQEDNPRRVCGHLLNSQGEIVSTLTLGGWIEKAAALAGVMARRGLTEGDRVILSLPTSEEFLVTFVGLWWLGAVPVPAPEVSAHTKKGSLHERLLQMVLDCSPRAIITNQSSAASPTLPGVEVWTSDDLVGNGIGDEGSPPPLVRPARDACAFVQYTSGSTGAPKGVVVTHASLMANMDATGRACGASPADSFLSWLPIYHDMGLIGAALWTTYWGMPFHLMSPAAFLSNPSVWLRTISRLGITLSIAPNFAYHLCARRVRPEEIENLDLSRWRLAFNGSEPIDPASLDLFQRRFEPYGFARTAFYPVYGMAEATLAISFPRPGEAVYVDRVSRRALTERGRAEPAAADGNDTVEFVSCGSPIPGHAVVIRDPASGKALGEREVGELCFQGPSVTPYYFHQSGQGSPRSELRTGDLGYIAEGRLFVVDRIKDLIQIAGVNYYPSDIEKLLQQIPGVRTGRVVALGASNAETGTSDLVIVSEITKDADLEALIKQIREKLYRALDLVPRDVVLAADRAIPITTSGKVQRRKCLEMYLHDSLPSARNI
ncbi:MAG: fatty acyl-AMP ligase [Nitrospirae bacterium]|nr:fatty acyl-AMP ligase [Nitrospirota bacterium]